MVSTVLGLMNGEPQKWAEKKAQRELTKREKTQRKQIERESGEQGPSPA